MLRANPQPTPDVRCCAGGGRQATTADQEGEQSDELHPHLRLPPSQTDTASQFRDVGEQHTLEHGHPTVGTRMPKVGDKTTLFEVTTVSGRTYSVQYAHGYGIVCHGLVTSNGCPGIVARAVYRLIVLGARVTPVVLDPRGSWPLLSEGVLTNLLDTYMRDHWES